MVVNNFRVVKDTDEEPPYLEKFDEINEHQIYKSTFNTDLYVIHEESKNNYHCIEYMSNNPFIESDLINYVNFYLETNG